MKKRNLKYFCFTGGCFSGKTTTMNLIKDRFENIHGIKTMILSEPIREYKDTVDISEYRKDAEKYLQLQIDTTGIRKERELSTVDKHKDEKVVILQDRGIADCIFYTRYYIDKEKLSEESQDVYEDLLFELDCFASDHSYNDIYDYVLEFKPLEIKAESQEQRNFRPNDIDEVKYIEYNDIHAWNKWFCEYNDNVNYRTIDLNVMDQNNLEVYIDNLAKEIKEDWK